jgi:hypothetical protein
LEGPEKVNYKQALPEQKDAHRQLTLICKTLIRQYESKVVKFTRKVINVSKGKKEC